MTITLTSRQQEGIEILALRGELTFGPEALELRGELDRLQAARTGRVVFDLSELDKLDSIGLGTLRSAHEQLQGAGGKLAIVRPGPGIDPDIELQLETSFETFETVQDAINSFFPERAIQHYDILEFAESVAAKPSDPPDVKQ